MGYPYCFQHSGELSTHKINLWTSSRTFSSVAAVLSLSLGSAQLHHTLCINSGYLLRTPSCSGRWYQHGTCSQQAAARKLQAKTHKPFTPRPLKTMMVCLDPQRPHL